MVKKIKVEQLKPGMFVHDFNCGWLHHPFLRNRVKIQNEDEIERILKHRIRELYIDTTHGIDCDDAPTQAEVEHQLDTTMTAVDVSHIKRRARASLKEEIVKARVLLADSKHQTQILMDAVKLGKQIDMDQVEKIVERMTESVLNNSDALISLARIKSKDEYTYLHSLAVAALCISFGEELELGDQKVRSLGIGGLLHDIGKVRVPGEILNKPGPLTEREFDLMKEHVKYGDCILRQSTKIEEDAISVTVHHHERLDGTGYPEALKGDDISIFGQIAAIVDIYDALTSERCYKNAMAPTDAMRRLFEWSDRYLNRGLVERFIAHMGIYPIGTTVRLQSGIIGVVVDHGERGLLYPIVRALYDSRAGKVVNPFDIDLSAPPAGAESDQIICCEAPGKWTFQRDPALLRSPELAAAAI
ncbi:MAG TPA: HD-GYP domain-containing protein [Candidatus Binatia bacterium]|jgi:putative nucleotidyltransferase with HDIG domain